MHDLSQETCDTGGITANRWYTYDKDPDLCRGNIVRFNYIHDVIGCGAYDKKSEPEGATTASGKISVPFYSWAIYFDNGPIDVLVYGNICARNTLGGIMISHYCKNVTVENNIFVDSEHIQAYLLLGGEMENVRFRRNIFSYSNPESDFLRIHIHDKVEHDMRDILAEFDNNLFFSPGEAELTYPGLPEGETRADWQGLGFDAHSITEDPMFVDPAEDDYSLHPESPALKLGFKPIDYSKIGLQKTNPKSKTQNPKRKNPKSIPTLKEDSRMHAREDSISRIGDGHDWSFPKRSMDRWIRRRVDSAGWRLYLGAGGIRILSRLLHHPDQHCYWGTGGCTPLPPSRRQREPRWRRDGGSRHDSRLSVLGESSRHRSRARRRAGA